MRPVNVRGWDRYGNYSVPIYVIFCSDSLLPRPVPLLSTLAFSTKDIQSIRIIQHVIPTPSRFIPVTSGLLGEPVLRCRFADSNNDSDDMPAAASNPTIALAGLTTEATKAVTVVADAVDASNVIADE